MTWSETATEEIRSATSRTLTPEGLDNYELLQTGNRFGSRRSPIMEENNVDNDINHGCHSSIRSPTLELTPVQEVVPNQKEPDLEINEWRQMAEVVDRFFFFMFVVFLIIPTSTILGIVRLFKPEL